MYTYIKNNTLYILNTMTGRLYRIGMSGNSEHIVVVHEDTLIFEADVYEHMKNNPGHMVRG